MTEIIHYDKFDKVIKVGDCVVFPNQNQLEIGIVKKITPKMIKVNQIGFTYNSQKYPKDTIVLEGPEVTMFLLKHQK